MPFAETRMDAETVIQSEVSQKDKNEFRIVPLICGIYKNDKMNLFSKQEYRHRHRECIYGYQGERGLG